MKVKIKKFLWLALLLIVGSVSWKFYPSAADIQIFEPKTYQEILASGIQPSLSPDDEFPTSYQYLNGCFGYAVGHILMQRGHEFDMLEMEKRIEKPRKELWKKEYKDRLAQEYGLKFEWQKKADTFFDTLASGEAVVLSYQYPLEDGKTILHAVAAYSFDDTGVWISETLSGQRKHLPYEEFMDEGGRQLQYGFARVVELES